MKKGEHTPSSRIIVITQVLLCQRKAIKINIGCTVCEPRHTTVTLQKLSLLNISTTKNYSYLHLR